MTPLTPRQLEAAQLLRLHRRRELLDGLRSSSVDAQVRAIAAEVEIERRIIELVEDGRRGDVRRLFAITIGLVAGAIAYWPVRLLGGRR